MTRERIEQLEALHAQVAPIKCMPEEIIEPHTFRFLLDCHHYAPELCALAKEALELREALEWMAERWLVLLKAKVNAGWCVCTLEKNAVVAIGFTPLEAINNARRGM